MYRTDLQVELLQYLKSRHKESHRVSVERVVSGNGLVAVYDFLCEMYQHMYVRNVASTWNSCFLLWK
jgi:glucokinase